MCIINKTIKRKDRRIEGGIEEGMKKKDIFYKPHSSWQTTKSHIWFTEPFSQQMLQNFDQQILKSR